MRRRFRWDKKYLYWGITAFLVIAAALVFLPVLSAVWMIAMILFFGRRDLRLSIFPVFIGVLGFAFKLGIDPRGESLLHHASAAVLSLGIVVLWALTVLYVIKTKWVLTILFLIPFFKHLFLDDLPVLLGTAPPLSAAARTTQSPAATLIP